MKKFKVLLLLFLIWGAAFAQEKSILEQLDEVAIIDQKVMIPMRDGVRIATDIYRPKGDAPVPIIFSRTPYNFNSYRDGELTTRTLQTALEAVKRGYAYVVQNERGRFFSEGEWDILGTPLTDGYDAFDWMEAQSWSNGKIGTIGCSSTAEWQMAVAAMDHPAHAALIPQGYGAGVGRIGDYYEQGNWYRGGAGQMLFTTWLYSTQHDPMAPRLPEGIQQEDLLRLQRFYDMAPRYPRVDWKEGLSHLPIQDIIKNVNGPKGIYEEMITRKPNDPKWFEGGLFHDDMEFEKPSFWFVSWYDVATSPNLALYNHVRSSAKDPKIRDNQYLVIAPTLHCAYTRATENTVVGERSMGDARLNYNELTYAWFDFWLKGEESQIKEEMPKVRYFTMGSNEWQSSDTWPPKEAQMTTFFLDSKGKANSRLGDGVLSSKRPNRDNPDSFKYDPMNPVNSYGGNVCCTGNAIQGGSWDQQEMELREDILVYTSDVLEEGIEVSGFIESKLYLSTDVKDTDLTIKLIDVYPDGSAYNLDETIQRVRYREGYEKEVFMEKGKVYEVNMTPMSTSNFFEKGHRIRIEVSSSNFPRFDRNMNTGGNTYDETEGVVATNNIHHSSKYPSSITLPIVKR
ncbi:putative hydrolase, CocE/NonD family [Belliella baltica DSM 15883]|uniref:Putative hydrolase, CocE/NonD family n=1 Tax=Belliella baltica (strain DSM 15883 / CIP 108006 / LMG 21964 / BA134) TaxID=866536 RepID=I3Z880_BELBD|nr:CocE/NonD family hydrolase [Belliella baltica]AFL85448.1 putative hydrolase, CocE/NonD family [Belliella baltica DSM 15883]